MGIAPIGLTCGARLSLGCATTQGVIGGELQLACGALRVALCRLRNDPWCCLWETWKWQCKGNALPPDYVLPGGVC